MKLTEQEQAAVSRGMIEGLLRALHAEACCRPSGWSWCSSCCAQAADMLRVAAYCRVSTSQEDQRKLAGESAAIFFEYISRQPDWELVEVYADEGLSGTSSDRPAFRRMLAAAAEEN